MRDGRDEYVKAILEAAKALIDTPEKWWADRPGEGGSKGRHCAGTALYWSSKGYDFYTQDSAFRLLTRAMGLGASRNGPWASSHPKIWMWNSTHSHAELMTAYDQAIQEAA